MFCETDMVVQVIDFSSLFCTYLDIKRVPSTSIIWQIVEIQKCKTNLAFKIFFTSIYVGCAKKHCLEYISKMYYTSIYIFLKLQDMFKGSSIFLNGHPDHFFIFVPFWSKTDFLSII